MILSMLAYVFSPLVECTMLIKAAEPTSFSISNPCDFSSCVKGAPRHETRCCPSLDFSCNEKLYIWLIDIGVPSSFAWGVMNTSLILCLGPYIPSIRPMSITSIQVAAVGPGLARTKSPPLLVASNCLGIIL